MYCQHHASFFHRRLILSVRRRMTHSTCVPHGPRLLGGGLLAGPMGVLSFYLFPSFAVSQRVALKYIISSALSQGASSRIICWALAQLDLNYSRLIVGAASSCQLEALHRGGAYCTTLRQK